MQTQRTIVISGSYFIPFEERTGWEYYAPSIELYYTHQRESNMFLKRKEHTQWQKYLSP